MGDVTRNISRHELACSCGCGLDSMDWETICVVQDVCDFFSLTRGGKVVLDITSAARCFEYNRSPAVGSNDASQHPKCRAMDIKIVDVSPDHVYDYVTKKYPNKYGVGKYETFTHIDTRTNGPARW